MQTFFHILQSTAKQEEEHKKNNKCNNIYLGRSNRPRGSPLYCALRRDLWLFAWSVRPSVRPFLCHSILSFFGEIEIEREVHVKDSTITHYLCYNERTRCYSRKCVENGFHFILSPAQLSQTCFMHFN